MAFVVDFSIFFFHIELPEEIERYDCVDVDDDTQQHNSQHELYKRNIFSATNLSTHTHTHTHLLNYIFSSNISLKRIKDKTLDTVYTCV